MITAKASRFLLVLFALAALAALAFAACDDEEEEEGVTPAEGETPAVAALGDVDVLGIWGGAELESFEAMVAPWEAETGGELDFIGTRDITPQLTLNIEGGTPPDVALPAEIGLFQQFARDGQLVPLSECAGLEETVLANYPQAFLDLATVDGTLYGFWMKADGKATIWYNPGFFADNNYEPLTADATFDDLVAFSQSIADDGVVAPWSIGVESGGASGWPGTDWIQAILLNNVEGGVEANEGLIDGSVPFTDPRVKEAWEKFGQIALAEGWTVQGGGVGINATAFLDAIFEPFKTPPTAALHHQAGFAQLEIVNQFPDAVAGDDFNFFPWPGGAVIGSANLVYAFNSDETTCSFLSHLASAEAQQIWVERGGFTSVNTQVSLDSYPDAVARTAAERLLAAETFRFDLDDTIGGAVQLAFWTGVTDYIADPGTLDATLAAIEAARAEEAEE